MITLDKTLARKLLEFLKNPITALVIALLTSVYFYFLSLSNKTPAYFITNPELIAQKTDDKLKILYNNVELNNIYSSTLILWNDGEKYIDYSDFIKDKPIKVFSKDSVNFLAVSLAKASRNDLKFHTTILNDTLRISLKNDEAFEEGDGAKFLMLFTKKSKNSTNPKFELDSRIKGTKEGFIYKDLANYKSRDDKFSLYLLWVIILFFLSFRIIILFLFKKPIVFRNTEAIIIFSLILIATYLTIKFIFYTTNLEWL